MTLKSCAPIVGVDVMSFDSEREVLLAWRVKLFDSIMIYYYELKVGFGFSLNGCFMACASDLLLASVDIV